MMRDLSNSTANKHGEATARPESEARQESIAASLPAMAICQVRRRDDGSLTWPFLSNRCRELLEVSAEAIQADANLLLGMIHPEDIWEFYQSLACSMSSWRSWHWQGRFILPSGKVKWIQLAASPEKMADGEILWDGLLLDITDRQTVILLAPDARRSDNRSEAKVAANRLTSAAQMRLFVENTPAAVAMCDRQMRYLAVSRSWLTEYRLSDMEIIGRSHYEVFPEIPDRWKEIHQRCLAGAVEWCAEDIFPRQDGSIDWVRWEIHPWRKNGAEIGGIIMFTEVITERKQVAEERDRFFDLSLDLLAIVGVDGYFKRVNPAVTRLLGYSSAEVIDRQLIDFVHPEDRSATIAIVKELSQGKNILEFENRYCCKDGSYKWLGWRGVTVESAGLIYAVARDITDRKRTELTLKKLNEELEVRVAERTAELGYTNSILLEEIGDRKRAESALRASEARLIEQKERLQEMMTELAYSNSILLEEIGDRKRAESALRASEARLIEQKEQLEQTLTELQQAQVQLVNSEKMSSLGQLVAGVAHEINNPVGFISGNIVYVKGYVQELLNHLRLYQQHYPNPAPEIIENATEIDVEFIAEDLDKMLYSMNMGTERIQQISKSLRNFSRSDQSKKTPFDIHEGIDSTLLILKYRLNATKKSPEIKLIQEYGQLPLVDCYPGQLNQVFMNLLANAIDALEEDNQQQGIICIRTEVIDDNWVAIYIADNGPGMTPEVQQQIFDALFTTKPVGKGTGLGLSISYSIVVEKHGGKLICNSRVGQGTEFTIFLPLRTMGSSA
ncbi:MAG: PAS domain S-box protein [Hormoscilla sp.]